MAFYQENLVYLLLATEELTHLSGMNLLDFTRLTHHILSSVGILLSHSLFHILNFSIELELLSLLIEIIFALLVFLISTSFNSRYVTFSRSIKSVILVTKN